MNEEEYLDKIFGENAIWTAKSGKKYELYYCDLCDTYSIKCSKCKYTSCNCGCCDECAIDFDEFINEVNRAPNYYLNENEKLIIAKYRLLKKMIKRNLLSGQKEINWKESQDQIPPYLENLFPKE